ncbi:odv-e25 [Adoxophyes orana granulovirus]|uniref:Odv-e25 n=1 Tax=Adoxophyes orana granulovirus TaxID=170617 RepID=Q7T9T8_GVAO|nr:odv-e25 [Adoxophyes orana granulovirus]AAP85714.1 odv-e25 [Adoxophyes orana granulovirus]AJA91717.1 ODV-E25 [Adoxophyes orana granulovirus]
MLGTLVLLLVIGAVLYLLWVNDKLNANSLNTSSESSGDSIQFTPEGNANVIFNNTKSKNVRIAYGENNFSKIVALETPIRHEQIIEHGDKAGANTICLGIIKENLGSNVGNSNVNTRFSNNLTIKQFKNLFITFKGLDYVEIDSNMYMVRYEVNKMVYALLDASNSTIPDLLRDVSYPICVLVNNSSAQLVLKEWGYTQINDSGTLYVKNEKSFRLG